MDAPPASPDVDQPDPDLPTRAPWQETARILIVAATVALIAGVGVWLATADEPPGPDSVDVGFIHDMTVHHEQALEMSLIVARNGEDPVVRQFAEEILLHQSYEIGRMDEMLRRWGRSRTERDDTAMAWMGMAVPLEQMPGLASDEEMAALRDATGTEADVLFMELMAAHHWGGIHMAEAAAVNASDPELRELAELMESVQRAEIGEFAQAAERLGLDAEIPLEPGSG